LIEKPMTHSPAGSALSIKPANQRSMARFAACQALYQMDVAGTSLDAILMNYEQGMPLADIQENEGAEDTPSFAKMDQAYFRHIVRRVLEFQKNIDVLLNQTLTQGWPLIRIDSLVRAILRCGTCELLYFKDVPKPVIINEYLDISKAYYDKEETRLVNGVLDNLAKQQTK
jgi:N utilization substance protein B